MKKCLLSPSMLIIYASILCALLLAAVTWSQTVTVITENTPIYGRKSIIIDAGHGGVDGGTTSCTGVLESAINLEIALRLEDLMHLLGIDTIMIRTTDISVYTEGTTIAQKKVSDLKQRVKIVNDADNAILISIHQNYFSDDRYSGAQIFYAENNDSKQLAAQMQAEFIANLNEGSRRQAKKADGIYLMQQINCTGILIECGFLSNPEEDAKLRSASYQKQICCVISSVCSKYLNSDSLA